MDYPPKWCSYPQYTSNHPTSQVASHRIWHNGCYSVAKQCFTKGINQLIPGNPKQHKPDNHPIIPSEI